MLPPVCEALNIDASPVGGWMISSLNRLKEKASDYQFAVATIWNKPNFKDILVEGVTYFLLPAKVQSSSKYDSSLEFYWQKIKEIFNPDIVHVHGTEFSYGLSYVKACGNHNVIASIQGIVSVIARYYTTGIEYNYVNRPLTLRDFIKRTSIANEQTGFEKRGKNEIEFIRSLNHIIGRTEWDKAHSYAINPQITYHHCGETLRSSFYEHKWRYEDCEPHSIFISQASYPIKGLHILLKALPLVLNQYPDSKIYVAGDNIIDVSYFRMSGYAKYLKDIIKENHLEGKVLFTGSLNEQQMCERYLKSNVFVCPSSIENSPNSLGEAQLLGMPYIASFVGGIPEIVNWNPEALYRFEEYEMLASKIVHIFDARDGFKDLSDLSIYDGNHNCQNLIGIYSKMGN